MGRICSADVTLDAKSDVATIKSIINHGSNLGFQYYIYNQTEASFEELELSIDEAVNTVIKGLVNSKNNTWGQSGKVSFNFQGNAPILSFWPESATTMCISIYTVSHPWCQDKSDNSKRCIADWDLYITLMLELCKDFAILKISTDDEYFNWNR